MRLILQNGNEESRWWSLSNKKLTMGRDKTCDIHVDDAKASRFHAEIVFENSSYLFIDKNSTNGSFINGRRVSRQLLMPGDEILLGKSLITVAEGSDTSRVQWQQDEAQPQITAKVSLDVIANRISEMTAIFDKQKSKKSKKKDQDIPEYISSRKLLKNLEVIYKLSRAFTSIMVLDDLYALIEKYLFELFPSIQRFCLLTWSEKKKKYTPRYLSAPDMTDKKGFNISRSIFNYTINNKVSVLTSDAGADSRFDNSASVIGLNLKSIMCAPLVTKNKILGALYCDNRTLPGCFDNHDLELFTTMANHIAVAIENANLYEEIQRSYHEAILALINAIEAKDPYTMGHTQRTSQYALGVAQELNLNKQVCQRIKTAAELHDIGKIGIREKIISKPTNLSNTEFETIQKHVVVGEKILKPITYLHYILPIIRGHHEHYDGSGYPDGLKKNEILLESRILAIADSFDAMTTQRPYNAPLTFANAMNECRKSSGTHFDPDVVIALERFLVTTCELTDSGTSKKQEKAGETPLN
jgi:GAF domain-containing protein